MLARFLVGKPRLSYLDERPVRARRAQEGLPPVRVVDVDVHELISGALELVDRRLDVVRLKGDVVKAFPVAIEEAGQEAVAERLQELDLVSARKPQLYPAPRAIRVAAHQVLAAEHVAVQRKRRLDRA